MHRFYTFGIFIWIVMPRTAHNCTRPNLTTFVSLWRCDLLSRKWTIIMVFDMQGASKPFPFAGLIGSYFTIREPDHPKESLTSIFHDTPNYLLLITDYIMSYIWYVSKQLQKLHSAMVETVINFRGNTVCQSLWKLIRFAQVCNTIHAKPWKYLAPFKTAKSDCLRHICPSVRLSAWNNFAPTGQTFFKLYIKWSSDNTPRK